MIPGRRNRTVRFPLQKHHHRTCGCRLSLRARAEQPQPPWPAEPDRSHSAAGCGKEWPQKTTVALLIIQIVQQTHFSYLYLTKCLKLPPPDLEPPVRTAAWQNIPAPANIGPLPAICSAPMSKTAHGIRTRERHPLIARPEFVGSLDQRHRCTAA